MSLFLCSEDEGEPDDDEEAGESDEEEEEEEPEQEEEEPEQDSEGEGSAEKPRSTVMQSPVPHQPGRGKPFHRVQGGAAFCSARVLNEGLLPVLSPPSSAQACITLSSPVPPGVSSFLSAPSSDALLALGPKRALLVQQQVRPPGRGAALRLTGSCWRVRRTCGRGSYRLTGSSWRVTYTCGRGSY